MLRINTENFIFASSGSVFGDAKSPMSEMTLKNQYQHGSSKLSIETFVRPILKYLK